MTKLSLYDIRGAPGVAADVGHIDTAAEVRPMQLIACWESRVDGFGFQVKGYTQDQLEKALDGAEVVVIPAGVPRKVRENAAVLPTCADDSPAWCEYDSHETMSQILTASQDDP